MKSNANFSVSRSARSRITPSRASSFATSPRCCAIAAPLKSPSRRWSHPWRDRGIDKVAGIEARGFILGGAVAHGLKAGFVPIRKRGKLPHETVRVAYSLEYGVDEMEMHKDAIRAGEKVLLLDDLIATGGTATAAAQLLKEAGAAGGRGLFRHRPSGSGRRGTIARRRHRGAGAAGVLNDDSRGFDDACICITGSRTPIPANPCSRSPRKGVEFESHYIDLLKFDQHQPEYLKINPDGTIPAMVHGDARAHRIHADDGIRRRRLRRSAAQTRRSEGTLAHALVDALLRQPTSRPSLSMIGWSVFVGPAVRQRPQGRARGGDRAHSARVAPHRLAQGDVQRVQRGRARRIAAPRAATAPASSRTT